MYSSSFLASIKEHSKKRRNITINIIPIIIITIFIKSLPNINICKLPTYYLLLVKIIISTTIAINIIAPIVIPI